MDVFQEIAKSLETEEQVLLATIISTTGSTPAAELSKMVVRDRGLTSIGTIGGGCLEAEVLQWARSLYGTGKTKIATFHLNEDNTEAGLICGGSLDVLIEPLDRSFLPVVKRLLEVRQRGEDGALVTILQGERMVAKIHVQDRASVASTRVEAGLEPRILETAQEVSRTHTVARFTIADHEVIVEPVAGQPRLILFGGGHVSKFVARFASQVGFRVTIVDDRVAFANRARFPEAAEIICDGFLEVLERLTITPTTYITIITRGHRFDELILERVIYSPAKYIGVIGSKRKILTAYRHYLEKGIPLHLLERIHAPIGLDIGAVTAEEIAVSIVAELIHIRRGGEESVPSMSKEMENLLATVEEKIRRGEV